jgi:ribonuclease HI
LSDGGAPPGAPPLSAAGRAWIDGASRGNPGEAGFGVVFESDGEPEEIAGFLGRTTNNVAEYAALVAALTHARRRGIARLTLYSDSELLVRQLAGHYRVKAPHLVPIYLKVLTLRRGIPGLSVRHVPREQNRAADALANRAIDQRLPVPEWLEL